MPFYEYECFDCDYEFEEFIRCDEDITNLHCPQCGSRNFGKKLSVFGMKTPSGRVVTSQPGGGSACTGCLKTTCAGCHS